MGELFYQGEKKNRPGAYYRIDRSDDAWGNGTVTGIGGCLFKSNWGPLNTMTEVTRDNYSEKFGSGQTTDVMKYMFMGGAAAVYACRIGSGGKEAELELENVGRITAKYVGDRAFTLTVRTKLSDEKVKEVIIYDGTKVFERYEIEKGGDEATALELAMNGSEKFLFEKDSSGEAGIDEVSQKPFTAGTNPTGTTESYSVGFEVLENHKMNVIAVDTEEVAVHMLLQAFLESLSGHTRFALGFVAEKTKPVANYEEKMARAAEFNSEFMHYILNPKIRANGESIDGYQAAALVAGLVASYECKYSMTHKILPGVSELLENVPLTVLNAAPVKGCIALTMSPNKEVWIDCGINTLVNPKADQDDGWKTIRRVKTRVELIERVMAAADVVIGNVDNDSNGRSSIISVTQGVINNMISEGSLKQGAVYESAEIMPEGNYAYFILDVIDKESVEKLYFTFKFQFSTNVTE